VNPPKPEDLDLLVKRTLRSLSEHGTVLGALVGQWLDTDPGTDRQLSILQKTVNARIPTNTVISVLADRYATDMGLDWRYLRRQMSVPLPPGRHDGDDPGPAPTLAS
jgi:hypothetical protein